MSPEIMKTTPATKEIKDRLEEAAETPEEPDDPGGFPEGDT